MKRPTKRQRAPGETRHAGKVEPTLGFEPRTYCLQRRGRFATTSDPATVLGHVAGGRVLDAATGDGQFIRFLLDGLKSHAEIVGIDSAPVEEELFNARFHDHPEITFKLLDVFDPALPDATFDTVSFANSLCVFRQSGEVLERLGRLLAPGGHLIVAADYRDFQTDAALTYVHLHDWWAAVDRTLGKIHHPSPRRAELVRLVSNLGLADLRLFDVWDPDIDAMDPHVIARIDSVIDRTTEKLDGRPELERRGDVLRRRMHEVGFRTAATLIAVGRQQLD